mmetsp:Transcript_13933/g.58154  ORF Transcript_13933/g.58154 Transcript_13933/m.58154 type:complete len:207 (-) Transcript_13933:136-756(-)
MVCTSCSSGMRSVTYARQRRSRRASRVPSARRWASPGGPPQQRGARACRRRRHRAAARLVRRRRVRCQERLACCWRTSHPLASSCRRCPTRLWSCPSYSPRTFLCRLLAVLPVASRRRMSCALRSARVPHSRMRSSSRRRSSRPRRPGAATVCRRRVAVATTRATRVAGGGATTGAAGGRRPSRTGAPRGSPVRRAVAMVAMTAAG